VRARFDAAAHGSLGEPNADPGRAPARLLTPGVTVQSSDVERRDEDPDAVGEAGGAASTQASEVPEPPGAVHHVTWGTDWLSITAHCAWRELGEAGPRRIEDPRAEKRRGRE
jgi:hypothetical protein